MTAIARKTGWVAAGLAAIGLSAGAESGWVGSGRIAIPTEAPPTPPPMIEADGTAPAGLQAQSALYSIGDPTPDEQLYLELINRARARPQEEAQIFATTTDLDVLAAYNNEPFWTVDLNLMVEQYATIPVVPPLAMNARLLVAARKHSRYQYDIVKQTHDGPGTWNLADRVRNEGYSYSRLGENVYATAASVFHGHAGFAVDWGFGPGGLQTPAGHRMNIHSSNFREAGLGIYMGSKPPPDENSPGVGPQLITQDFGTQLNATPLLTGVAYFDLNGNNFYDVGEGIGGLTITVDRVSQAGATARSGGYAVPINTGNGSYTVRFTGPGLDPVMHSLTIANGENAKLDLTPVYAPPAISGPEGPSTGRDNAYAITPVVGASRYRWRSFQTSPAPAEPAESNANIQIEKADYPILSSLLFQSGRTSFNLQHKQNAAFPQRITLRPQYLVQDGASFSFYSRLRSAAADQMARVQISTDEGLTWRDLYTQNGTGDEGETIFHLRSISLAEFAGQSVRIRFSYEVFGRYLFGSDPIGWFIDNINFQNVSLFANLASSESDGPSFNLRPTATGDLSLQAQARSGHEFLPWGPVKRVNVVQGPAEVAVTGVTALNASQARIAFELRSGKTPAGYVLQSKPSLGAAWANDPAPVQALGGNQFQATATLPAGAASRFFRVLVNP